MSEETRRQEPLGVNERIIAREHERLIARDQRLVTFANFEEACVPRAVEFYSPDVKRVYVRYFDSFQYAYHAVYASSRRLFAKAHLDLALLTPILKELDKRIEGMVAFYTQTSAWAYRMLERYAIDEASLSSYKTPPLKLTVSVFTPAAMQVLEALKMFDRLQPILETLRIFSLITIEKRDAVVKELRRHMVNLVMTTRRFARGVFRRHTAAMRALREREAAAEVAGSGERMAMWRSQNLALGPSKETEVTTSAPESAGDAVATEIASEPEPSEAVVDSLIDALSASSSDTEVPEASTSVNTR